MGDVAFVPKGNIFHSGQCVAAKNSGETAETFPRDGVALVRHGTAALLTFGEGLLSLEHLGALQVTEFHRPALDAGTDHGDGVQELCVVLTLHNLRGERSDFEPELFANIILHARRQMRVSANRAGEFTDGGHFFAPFQS